MLTIVPTPIGNLKDITLRALEELKSCDGIICEDTRRTSILLNHYEINKPLTALNDFNEAKLLNQIIDRLKLGQNLALVSDAGTPLISDPGYKLVRECLAQDIPVDSLPGAVSPIVALTLSGLPPDKFTFLGYFPEKTAGRLKLFAKMQQIAQITPMTFIFFAAPFKLKRSLGEMQEVFGEQQLTIASELTKIHQASKTQTLPSWIEHFKSKEPKGEQIVLIHLP